MPLERARSAQTRSVTPLFLDAYRTIIPSPGRMPSLSDFNSWGLGAFFPEISHTEPLGAPKSDPPPDIWLWIILRSSREYYVLYSYYSKYEDKKSRFPHGKALRAGRGAVQCAARS